MNLQIDTTYKYNNSNFNQNDLLELKKNLGFVPQNLYMVKSRSSDENKTPEACLMYPLSKTSRNGKLEPFPTICWLTSKELKVKVSFLESKGLVKEFRKRLLSNIQEYGLIMRKAHQLYALERQKMISEEDNKIIIQKGWEKAFNKDIGISGIIKKDIVIKTNDTFIKITSWDINVKCLHAHLAHYLVFPEHNNIIGKWTLDLLNLI